MLHIMYHIEAQMLSLAQRISWSMLNPCRNNEAEHPHIDSGIPIHKADSVIIMNSSFVLSATIFNNFPSLIPFHGYSKNKQIHS